MWSGIVRRSFAHLCFILNENCSQLCEMAANAPPLRLRCPWKGTVKLRSRARSGPLDNGVRAYRVANILGSGRPRMPQLDSTFRTVLRDPLSYRLLEWRLCQNLIHWQRYESASERRRFQSDAARGILLSCPKTQTEPKAGVPEAFSKLAETRRHIHYLFFFRRFRFLPALL